MTYTCTACLPLPPPFLSPLQSPHCGCRILDLDINCHCVGTLFQLTSLESLAITANSVDPNGFGHDVMLGMGLSTLTRLTELRLRITHTDSQVGASLPPRPTRPGGRAGP